MSSQLQDALGMFAFLAIELSVLFIGISLLVGVLQGSVLMSGVNLHGGVAATVGLRKLEVTTPSPITERHHDDRGQDGID